MNKIRISKFLSEKGIVSRRETERLINLKKISVNGIIIESPITFVDENDEIKIDSKKINQSEKIRCWIYHKPNGQITTHNDPQNRETVFDFLKEKKFINLNNDEEILKRVISVGRLDINSEGLLLLTNSSKFAHKAEKSGWERSYDVKIYGKIIKERFKKNLKKLKKNEFVFNNLVINSEIYKFGKIITNEISDKFFSDEEILKGNLPKNAWIKIIIKEGKNREIRKILNYFGFMVNKLVRTEFGPFKLRDLKKFSIKEIEFFDYFE